MRILITGGGTGGHVNPAIAIADYLKKNIKDITIEFVGTEKGIESKLVPKAGYKLHTVKVQGFLRKLTLKNFVALYRAFSSQSEAKKIIKMFKPDIVVGTGGFASWPLLAAATKKKIPSVIVEPNAYPGVTTKMLAGKVDKVLINFPESKKYFKRQDNLVMTGIPVREGIITADPVSSKRSISPDRPLIISYGGSMGAHWLNKSIVGFMESYSQNKNIRHIHATGSIGYSEFLAMFREKKLDKCKNLELLEYIYDMPKLMAAADIIICRAGANTIAELATMRKPAIFIPSPYVTENHQYKNAKVLEDAGAAVIIEEKNLSPETLEKAVGDILGNFEKRKAMCENIHKFSTVGTLPKIASIIKELYKINKKG